MLKEGSQQTVQIGSKAPNNETLFELKRSGVYLTCVSVIVDFSPINQQNNQNIPQQSIVRSTPIFNRDNNFFTPTFILEADREKYQQNRLIYKQLFQQKIKQADQQAVQMYLPRPSKTNSFCCVCKMVFEDYLTHVNLPIHKAFMQKSQFYAEIQNICGKFTTNNKQQTKKKTNKKQTKTKTVKKQKKQKKPTNQPKRQKKIAIDSISTSRGHSSNEELVVDGVNC